MTKQLATGLTLLPLLFAACEPSQPEQAPSPSSEPAIETTQKQLTSESVAYVPPGFDPRTITYDFVLNNYTLFATHNLFVKERSKIFGVIGANNYVEIREGALVTGHVTSHADARMIHQSKIEGDATIGATSLVRDPTSAITGIVKTSIAIPEVALSNSIPPNPGTAVKNGACATLYLKPGNYASVNIPSCGKLTLYGGVYNIKNLNISPDAELIIFGGSTVTIYVAGSLNIADRARINVWERTDPDSFQIFAGQTSQLRVGTDVKLNCRLVAAQAEVVVSSRTAIGGSVLGKDVVLEPDVVSVFTKPPYQPSNYQEFAAHKPKDPRHTATAHNFADGGAYYVYKIINGRIYYSREYEFKGEFGRNGSQSQAHYTSYHQLRAGKTLPAPVFNMVAADNNTVFAVSTESGSPQFFWGQPVELYRKDYTSKELVDGVWQSTEVSETATYTKVDPEVSSNPDASPPIFDETLNKHNHFSTINYHNDKPLKLEQPEFNISIDLGDMPDLGDAVVKYKANVVKDAMAVRTQTNTWYQIHGVPPRNGFFGDVAQMEAGYDARKSQIFVDMFADFKKILTQLLTDSVMSQIKTQIKAYIESKKDQEVKRLEWWQKLVLFITGNGDLPDEIANELKAKVDGFSRDTFADAIATFYTGIYTSSLAGPFDKDTYKAHETQFKNAIVGMFNDMNSSHGGRLSIPFFTLGLGLGNIGVGLSGAVGSCGFGAGFGNLGATIVNTAITVASWPIFSLANGDENDKETAVYWIKKYWNGLNHWYNYFKYPSDIFEMQAFSPYPAGTMNAGAQKTRVTIKRVIDIGVGNPSRYEHYRNHNGGQAQNYFGEPEFQDIRRPGAVDMSKVQTRIFPKGLEHGSIVEGNGYNDGTLNFFILAEIGMDRKVSGLANKSYERAFAVLWLDEQEFFSERWHVLHPRDNAFEGAAGTFLGMFPVLAWADGQDMNAFEEGYWHPYFKLSEDARMDASRYGIVVADPILDEIYTTSFFWATTDRTWRRRPYPFINPKAGESVDKQSVKIRDDMTIYLEGKKSVTTGAGQSELVTGYFYQRLLNHANEFKGVASTVGGIVQPPNAPYDHPWHFMEKKAFEYADRNFFRMGMYEGTTYPFTSPSYKGYSPKTHIFRILRPKFGNDVLDLTALASQEWFRGMISSFGSDFVLMEMNDADEWVDFVHPMDVDLHGSTGPVVMRVLEPTEGQFFARFVNRRYDDLGIFNPAAPAPSTPIGKDIRYRRFMLAPAGDSSSGFELGVADADHSDFEDMNVWSDAKANEVIFMNTGTTLLCSYLIEDANKYRFKAVKLGYLEGGTHHVLELPTIGAESNFCSRVMPRADWDAFVAKYLSAEGRIKYGTHAWIEEAFGNGNVFSTITPASP